MAGPGRLATGRPREVSGPTQGFVHLEFTVPVGQLLLISTSAGARRGDLFTDPEATSSESTGARRVPPGVDFCARCSRGFAGEAAFPYKHLRHLS